MPSPGPTDERRPPGVGGGYMHAWVEDHGLCVRGGRQYASLRAQWLRNAAPAALVGRSKRSQITHLIHETTQDPFKRMRMHACMLYPSLCDNVRAWRGCCNTNSINASNTMSTLCLVLTVTLFHKVQYSVSRACARFVRPRAALLWGGVFVSQHACTQ